MRNLALAFSLFLAVTLGLTPVSWADCPTSMLWECGSDAGQPSTLAGAKTAEGGIQPWSVGQPCNEGCYDSVHGALEALGGGDILSPGCAAGAWMVDDYWIDGPPSAQPLTFEAVLFAEVTITGTSFASGRIDFAGFSTSNSGPQTVMTSLTKSVGEVFSLQADLSTGAVDHATGMGHATATLRFRGLPAGYSVVSCQGYALPTPARSSSWGRLKAAYR